MYCGPATGCTLPAALPRLLPPARQVSHAELARAAQTAHCHAILGPTAAAAPCRHELEGMLRRQRTQEELHAVQVGHVAASAAGLLLVGSRLHARSACCQRSSGLTCLISPPLHALSAMPSLAGLLAGWLALPPSRTSWMP